MKRILALFLATLMLLATLSSCDFLENFAQIRGEESDSEATTPDATTPEGTTPGETTPEETTPEDTPPDETTPGPDDPPKPPVVTTKTAATIVDELNADAVFNSTFGCDEAILSDVSNKEEIISAFTREGFVAVAADMVEGAKIETLLFSNQKELVTLYWIASEKEMRITWEAADEAALSVLQKNASTGGGTLTMVQIGVARGEAVDNPMIGMCYVFKLSNGNAMIIDGGYYYDDCATNLYNALAKLDIAKTEDDKYIIEAWIFTHGHGDHDGVLNNFVPLYGDKTEVNYFLYQFPVNTDISATGGGLAGEEAFHELCKTAYPNATYINPRTGLNYYFGNATVSMLYTPDVLWAPDNKLTYYNNTSLIFNVHGGGTGFLCMGDAGDLAAKRSWELFDEVAYKSGILQITHHGLTTDDKNIHVWDNIKKIYEATGVSYAVLPMGTRIGDSVENGNWKSGNGRWAVLFQYAYDGVNGIGGQMSMFVKQGDAPTSNGYFGQELFNRFIATVETGFNYMEQQSPYFKNVKSLHGYNGINMIDNGDGLITYISSRDKTEMATVFLFAKGGVTVKKNEELSEWLKLPEFNAADIVATLNPTSVFESTFGNTEAVLQSPSGVKPVLDAFRNAEFALLNISTVDDAKFETFILSNEAELVTVYYRSSTKEVRIVWEKLDENILPLLSSNQTTNTGELTLVQVGVERGPGDTGNPMIGMCYVIKLSDGRAIIIDGGFNYENNADNLFGTLSRLGISKNADGQYMIAAWFFSHGDGDHIGIMTSMGSKYSEKIDVEYIIHQLPSNSLIAATSAKGETEFFERCKAIFPNAIFLTPHAGVQYFIGNAVIDMLYTPDLVWSSESKITYYNSTSIVFKVNGGGTSFLSTGDAGESAFKVLWESYEPIVFTCDMFQVPHHGLTTQNTEDGTGNYAAHGWTYMKKVFSATGAKYAILPMGDRNPSDSRNGRATVIIFWGSANCVISYFIDKDDKSLGAMSAENYQAFVDSVAAGTNTHKTYLGYNGINILDNGNGLITYMASNETNPMATVFSFANGTLTVLENEDLHKWLNTPVQTEERFESTFDSEMEIYTNVKSSELFTAPLVADGYKILDVTMIEGAKFETILLQKGTSLVTLYWFAESGDLRIAYDTIQESATAPLSPNEETGKGELIVAQVGADVKEPGNQNSTENNPNIGLCYIFKLSNGHAIIIDGGFYYQSNADNIYKSLVSLDIAKDSNGKYVVEAWIFTHGHGDHNGATAFFFPSYSQKVDVKNFVYQLPTNKEISPTGAGYAGEEAFHELCKTTYPNANYINPRTGLTYYFGNAEVDMFHTPDFIWSHTDPIPDYNDSGIIFRITGGGVEGALFMGDSGEHPSTATVKNYDVSAFNSNIVQISHHGLNTQVNEGHEWRNMKVIYEGATAEYAFLPMGVAKPNVRSGRWSVLCGWGYTGKQASFVINTNDDDRGVDQTAWNTFVSGILDGSLEGETLLGYNGHNIIDNGQGRITYIHCSETDPMVTIMSFKDGKITVELNQELYDWFEETK